MKIERAWREDTDSFVTRANAEILKQEALARKARKALKEIIALTSAPQGATTYDYGQACDVIAEIANKALKQ